MDGWIVGIQSYNPGSPGKHRAEKVGQRPMDVLVPGAWCLGALSMGDVACRCKLVVVSELLTAFDG